MKFESGVSMQLDIFLPNISLAFEYQGEQHYFDIHCFGPQQQYARRDEQKRRACGKADITLIEIPYWWDFELDSLKATVHDARPDLIPTPGNGTPISETPPIPRSLNSKY
jgi:hypothetical protein